MMNFHLSRPAACYHHPITCSYHYYSQLQTLPSLNKEERCKLESILHSLGGNVGGNHFVVVYLVKEK